MTTFFIIYFIKSLLRPIAQLKEGTRILGQGNLHYRIENRSEDELGKLAENFNEMAVSLEKKHKEVIRLKELDKIKSQFVSTASHQLRTPLTAIRWIVSMLLKRRADGKVDAANDSALLHTLYDSNLRMINLVNNLLDASKLETQSMKLNKKPVSLVELIEKQITELVNQIIEKDIHVYLCLERESVGTVSGDKDMLGMVVQNLLSNAIHYNKRGGYVRITLNDQVSAVVLTIADSGIGIQTEDSRNLFTKFYRGREATSLKTDGSGLGLFITKSIIKNHGGKIWFTSKAGVGTTFHVKLLKK
jgi:signal transduction histidine kinase